MKNKLIVLIIVVVAILIFGGIRVQNNNAYEKTAKAYFEYLSEKDFDKLNKIVTDDNKIVNEERKEYISKVLVYIKPIEIEELKDDKCNGSLDGKSEHKCFRVKYESKYSNDFISVGSEKAGINVVEKRMVIGKVDGKLKVISLGF